MAWQTATSVLRSNALAPFCLESLWPSAASTAYRDANSGLYNALDTYSNQAMARLASDNAAVDRGGQLTPEEIRNAQQSAREGWAARGLVRRQGGRYSLDDVRKAISDGGTREGSA